jgi:hypothetical protein
MAGIDVIKRATDLHKNVQNTIIAVDKLVSSEILNERDEEETDSIMIPDDVFMAKVLKNISTQNA